MKCVIIEDEFMGQEVLKHKLKLLCPQIKVVKIIDNTEEAIEYLNSNYVDLVFLDMQIIGGSGLDVLRNIEALNFHVIFITAYKDFALEAFSFGALHYLLKPIKDSELIDAVNRINTYSRSEKGRIIIHSKYDLVLIEISEIVYIQAEGSYSNVQTHSKKIIASKNLGEFEKMLPDDSFIRVHKSFLINISFVEKIVKKNRAGIMYLKNGEQVPVAQRRIGEIIPVLEQMH